MTRQQGVNIQTAGMLIIVSVMLLDKFIFSIQEEFILVCAIISVVLMAVGIRAVKKADDNNI
jgi:hypothetical protein